MPRSRSRGGTRMPRAGDDTTCPAMLISPAGTAKLTPSIAGRPTENCLRRSVTSSVAVMISMSSWMQRSLPIAESLVPVGNPWPMQLYVLVEFREPDFYDLGIEAIGIDRRALGREEYLDRRAVFLFRVDRVVEQGAHRDFAAHQRIRHRRARRIEDRMGRSLLRPIILP